MAGKAMLIEASVLANAIALSARWRPVPKQVPSRRARRSAAKIDPYLPVQQSTSVEVTTSCRQWFAFRLRQEERCPKTENVDRPYTHGGLTEAAETRDQRSRDQRPNPGDKAGRVEHESRARCSDAGRKQLRQPHRHPGKYPAGEQSERCGCDKQECKILRPQEQHRHKHEGPKKIQHCG